MINPSPIIKAALVTSMNLATLGANSWFRSIEWILKFCHLDYLIYTSDLREIELQLTNLGERLRSAFIDKWTKDKFELLDTNNRLKLLINSKDKFEPSKHLTNVKIPLHRIAISKIRLSAHRLPI